MNSTNQKYILEITKKLESFKNAKEWSDFISLLTSLDSTIKSYALPYVPKKELLIKRLEQCLNHLLPAGVHNKALETYSIIFETISKEELEENFGVYTLGLFTFASHSRLLVLSFYLDVIERHIIPFGSNIEIYSLNILMGLLPPLESKTNEYYGRVMLILDAYKSNIDDGIFYSSLWSLFLSNCSVRLPIINFLMDTQDDLDKIAQEMDLVIKALCKGLDSKDSLVLRGTLDIISTLFPLNSKKLPNNFKYDLLEGVLRLFLKRDLSLNKRVFSWMGYKNNSDNQNLRVLKNTLVRYLDKEKDLAVFFKVFVTLATKSRLSEQILEHLLFKVLKQVKKVFDNESAIGTSKEVEDIKSYAKNFLTENLDVLWKLFYLKTKAAIVSKGKDLQDKSSIELQDPLNDTAVSLRIEELDISNGREETIVPLQEGTVSKAPSLSKIDESSFQTQSGLDEPKNTNESLFFDDTKVEEPIEDNPSDLLFYIDFCCENFNVFDDNVLETHLPIFIILVLKGKNSFDSETLLRFLRNNVKKVKLIEQSEDCDKEIIRKTDQFYKNEDLNTLNSIRSGFCRCLVELIRDSVDLDIENTHSFYIDFILNHKNIFNFNSYVKHYYNLVMEASLKTIGNSLRLFNSFSTDCVKSEGLFNELWSRFCKQKIITNQDEQLYNNPKWSISINTELSVSQVVPSAIDSVVVTHGQANEGEKDFEKKAMDKKYIVMLLYDYNIVFLRKYEKYLLRKVSEENKHNICLFIQYLFELNDNTEHFFYNIFFIINNKISDQDPVITALIKSLLDFKGAFLFLIRKFEEAHILSNNYFYIDEPNLNQLKGVVCCLKNMILFSRRFRVMLKNSRIESSNKIFGCTGEIYAKTIVYKMLKYIFMCEIKEIDTRVDGLGGQMSLCEVKNKVKSQQEAININRNIKIECIKLIMELANMKIIDKDDVNDSDLPFLVTNLLKYRLDPAIILPSSILIRLSGKQSYLLEFASILDSKCFYYFDLLEFLFQLPLNQKKTILKSILLNLGKDNYALMIKHEIVKEIIDIEDPMMNWNLIVQKLLKDSISFYDEDVPVEDQTTLEANNDRLTRDSQASHTINVKINAVVETSNIIYSKLSGYFIEHLISLPFPDRYIRDLDFKVHIFATILSSYTGNFDRIFSFLLEFYNLLTKAERQNAYNQSKKTLFQVINYRSETYPSTLLFLLKVFSEQSATYEETSSFLSLIYQAISYISKNLDNRRSIDPKSFQGYASIMTFLSTIEYTENIRSASQTYIGFLIDLIKHQDKAISTFALGEFLKLSNNKSITEGMWCREFMEYLNHPNFFNINLSQKCILSGKIANYKVEVIDELISRLDSSFFASLSSDITNKCSVLERIAFLIFSASFDRYSSFNIKLIEIIPNLIQNTSSKIRRNVLFLIRVMLYKISHIRLPTIFPIIFSEIIGILNRVCDEDSEVVLECLKLIDMIFLMNTEEVMEFKNIISNKLTVSTKGADECEGRFFLLNKALMVYKKRKDLLITNSYEICSMRRLFFTSKNPSYNEIGSFMAVCGEFYELQDKNCIGLDKARVDELLLSEIEN